MISLLVLLSCGRPINETGVKLVGVGYHPDSIGPEPELFGGIIEYDYFDFAGGGLSLASLGLVSYDAVGPGLIGFHAPYAAVYGLAFVFDEQVPAPDVHHGNIGIPPEVEDSCWTNFEPFSYLMASTVEMGDEVAFTNADGSVEFPLGRYPEIYPPDPQDVFVYYIGVEAAHETGLDAWLPESLDELSTLRPANWRHGETMTLSYPGGIPPLEAPVSSIPLPSTVVEPQQLTLPSAVTGLALSWEGLAYGPDGEVLESGSYGTCVRFVGSAEEGGSFDPSACAESPVFPEKPTPEDYEFTGQLYTGPWDTSDGSVTFHWTPGGAEGEVVSLNVRFLAAVDRTADSVMVGQVPVDATNNVQNDWEDISDLPLAQGYRTPLACDPKKDIEYSFNSAFETSDGSLVTSMQGDPSSNLAEVSCRLADDGEFTLTTAQLADALEYAAQKGGAGAVFYFTRSTELDAEVPFVKDQAEMVRDIGTVKVRANTVELGRFWVESPAVFEQGGQ